MIAHPNCKINLGLNIIARRPDGYHDIETVFYPVPLCDELSVVPSSEEQFEAEGIPVAGNPSDNLVMKVVQLLRDNGYHVPTLSIKLRKQIPSGAGLGGGSSDAAHMMLLLNSMCELHLSPARMKEMLRTLGADCPFFIENAPVFAQGIGDQFSPVSLDLSGWHLTLVKPDVSVSTKEAYALVEPHKPNTPINQIVNIPVEEWKECLVNDFEVSVFTRRPVIGRIKERLYQKGAVYASMSGSGSSVFALSRIPIYIYDDFADCFHFHCTL